MTDRILGVVSAGRKFDLGRKKGIKSQCKVKLKANIAVAQECSFARDEDERRALLRKHEIEFDERYLWD